MISFNPQTSVFNREPSAVRPISRRSFLRKAAAGLGLPAIVPSSVFGRLAPSNRVAVAHIGVGGQGTSLLQNILGLDPARVVAVCDAFAGRRERAAALVNEANHDTGCATYPDLREMLARPDIDAVVIATPDHWHVPAAMLAVTQGKDVYVEKPLGISVEQGQALRAACRRHAAVFQYGTQQRSSRHIRHGCELVLNGRIGKITSVEVVSPASSAGGSTVPIPVPEGFDYDQWLGPAPWAPYTKDRCTNSGAWFVSDYALGFIAGWGAHPLDVMLWALGDRPEGVPVEYEGTGTFPPQGLFDTATAWDVRGRFGDGAEFIFRGPGENLTVFTGERGKVSISRGWLRTEPESLQHETIGAVEIRLESSTHHQRNFIEAVRSRRPAISPIHSAVLSDTVSHLSDIAIRTGRRIIWDPVHEVIVGDPAASRYLHRPMRAPWTL